MIIAIDFDGTCVDHRYPLVGPDLPHAEQVIQKISRDHKIILWTMRSGKELQDAVQWFVERSIPLFGINRNPEQDSWTSSPKAYAQVYIGDDALGAPIIHYDWMVRPGIDWMAVENILYNEGIK